MNARLNALLLATTTVFLFVAPIAGSAGLRSTMLIVSAAVLVALHVRGLPLEPGSLPRAVLGAFAAWALFATASLAWSVDRAYTLGELRAEIFYGTLAFGVFLVAGRDAARWSAWRHALLLGALLIVAMHLLQPLLPFILSRHRVDGQAGLWSTYLVIVAPLLLTLGWPKPWGGPARPVLQAVALLLLFGAAWDTGNRAVWLALGVEIAVALALSRPVGAADRARLRTFRWVALTAVVIVAVAMVGSIKDRSAFADPGATMGDALASDLRPRIWAVAWAHFLDAPFVGHGFGREILAAEFVKITPAKLKHPAVEHAHNLFIDVAVQLGALGLAAFLALLVALFVEYCGHLRDSRVAPLGVLGLTLLAGFLVKNLTDDFLHRHNGVVFWALNGMLVGLARARLGYPLVSDSPAGEPRS